MNKHTIQELYQWQSLPLSIKIRMTQQRIRDWVNEYGEDGVYVSFSGGKDSTVLLDIVRNMYPNIPAVFVDVPTQYPELKSFATSFDNVTVLHPKTSFMQVCEEYGFPLISKEISEKVMYARKYLKRYLEKNASSLQETIPYAFAIADLLGIDRRNDKNQEVIQQIKNGDIPIEVFRAILSSEEAPIRVKQLLGTFLHKEKGVLTSEPSKMYDSSRYQFFLKADFEISNQCCNVMKKKPVKKYGKETGRHPMTAQMASESKLREQNWLQSGCNAYDAKEPVSNPMAFWTDQDVLLYIKTNNLPICSVYGDIVVDYDGEGQLEGQLRLDEVANCESFDIGNPLLKTTGCSRTGCMLCGFGCHLEKSPNRFEMLKETHPGMYKLLDVVKNNGVTFREAIEWTNEHGNMDIKL